MTRFTAKVLANSLSATGALLCLVLVLVVVNHGEWLDELGNTRIKSHHRSFKSKTENILEYLRSGRNDLVVDFLERPEWKTVRYGDRAYPLKRKILSRLCRQLHTNKDYDRLLRWASEWRDLNERDVDAIAYWHEAHRHTPGKEMEGLQGLIRESRRFPRNGLLTRFLIAAYRDVGDKQSAKNVLLEHTSAVAKDISSGWRMFWTVRADQGETELISRVYTLSSDNHNRHYLSFQIPSNTVKLRLDPPAFSNLRISGIQLEVNELAHTLPAESVKINQMLRQQETLLVTGEPDPYFYFDTNSYIKAQEGPTVDITIRFQIHLIIGSDELPLSGLL